MLREWTSAQVLGHENLRKGFNILKRSFENVALTPPLLTVYDDTVTTTNGNRGGFLRITNTFAYRIEDVTYIKGLGITQTINTGDKVGPLLAHNPDTTVDQTAAYAASDITATYYRAGVLLINSAGTFSFILGPLTGRGQGIGAAGGARTQALANLLDYVDTSDIEDKAIVAFYVIGDGTNAFTSTTSLTISTNLDLYQCGGRALSSGQSYDGNMILGLL